MYEIGKVYDCSDYSELEKIVKFCNKNNCMLVAESKNEDLLKIVEHPNKLNVLE